MVHPQETTLINEVHKEFPHKGIWEIVAGDFNDHNKLKVWNGFSSFVEITGLRDIWRERNPSTKQFTWIKNPTDP